MPKSAAVEPVMEFGADKYEPWHHFSATLAFKPNYPITILFYELFSATPTHLIGNFI